MPNLGYEILFWLEVGLGIIALAYAALALYTVLRVDQKQEWFWESRFRRS